MISDIAKDFGNFVVSIGTESLKEKGEIRYNEEKIKNELTEYVQRESGVFENIGRNCEIDFGNLQAYVTEKLLGNFRMSLFGDINAREKSMNSMLESIYMCTGADTREKKKYVDKIVNIAFEIIKNYYETQMIKSEDLYLSNKIVDDIRKELSSVKNQEAGISMVQHGSKNQQIGQVSSLTINNN